MSGARSRGTCDVPSFFTERVGYGSCVDNSRYNLNFHISSTPSSEARCKPADTASPPRTRSRLAQARLIQYTCSMRSLFAPSETLACRCSFSKSKRYAAATTACLLPRAISPPMLTALCFCLASADRICLLRRCIIITDFANVLADMPMMSCVGSSLLHDQFDHTAFAHSVWSLELGRRHSTTASLCH